MIQKSASSFFPPLLWLAAFVAALYPVNDWQYILFAVSIILMFCWSVLLLGRGLDEGWRVPKSPVMLFAGLFWILTLASVFWSEIKPASVMTFCLMSLLPLTFFTNVIRPDRAALWFIGKTLAVIFAVLGLWAIIQFFFLNAYFMGQARHPLADPSSFGALLSLGLFGALGWVFQAEDKRSRILSVLLGGVLLAGILATASRGPVFAFIPAFIVMCFLLRAKLKEKAPALLAIFLIGAAFYGLSLTGIQKKYDMGSRLFGADAMAMGDVSNNRFDIWKGTIELIKERPLLGTGLGTFAMYYPEHRPVTHEDGTYFAHNDPLQFWQEMGLFGPLLFYAFIAAACLRSFASLKRLDRPEDDARRIVIVSTMCGLAAMVIQSHVSFNHYNASILLMSGFLLSVWFFATAKDNEEDSIIVTAAPAPPGLAKLLLAIPFLLVSWIMVSLLMGEYYASRARDDLFANNMVCWTDKKIAEHDCFEQNILMADRVSMGMNSRAYLFAANVPMAILQSKEGKFKNEQEARDLYEQVVFDMGRVLEINPRDASAHYYLGRVQSLVPKSIVKEGTPDEASEYRTALRLDPMHVGARLALYRLYTEQKKPVEERLAVMEPGANFTYITPVAADYYAELAKLYLEMGDYGKMQDVLWKSKDFQKRSEYSRVRQNTSIPQAITGGDSQLPALP